MRTPVFLIAAVVFCGLLFLGCNSGSGKKKPTAGTDAADTGGVLGGSGGEELPNARAGDEQVLDAAELGAVSVGNEGDLAIAGDGMTDADLDGQALETERLPPAIALEGNWTRQRLIAYSPGGPTIIDLEVSLAGKSLEEATEEITEELSKEVFEGLDEPVQWSELLGQPLVKSGWLGNLVAEEDQESQLITMYDQERDDAVDLEELGRFLSRGLARSEPLRVNDIGSAPNSNAGSSPWGVADKNGDYSLDKVELAQFGGVISAFDYNGDAIVALQELNQSNDMQNQPGAMSSSSMLETNTMLVAATDNGADGKDEKRQKRKVASEVHSHYTFLDGIPRDQWTSWTDERWKELDQDENQILKRQELGQISTVAPDVVMRVRFPALQDATSQPQVWMLDGNKKLLTRATQSPSASRVEFGRLVAEVVIDDSFSGEGPKLLRQQLEAALQEPQLQTFFTQQLQLQEDAFELIDPNGDEQLSDEEFERVWRWLTSRQGSRLLGRWMTAQVPWFLYLDADADQRLNEVELTGAAAKFLEVDSDGDSLLTPSELPLLVKLEIRRTDTRLNNRFPAAQGATVSPEDLDWFSAMDTNADGFISQAEFLGDAPDFDSLDGNSDGFIARPEVY